VPPINLKRILCPTDFSEGSQHALAFAVALAQWYDAQVTVMHVIEIYPVPAVLPGNPSPVVGPYVSREAVAADLERFTAALKHNNIPFEIAIEQGTAAQSILETAKRVSAELVVIGTHGRGGFEHLVLGSVAEKVLRKAKCPVLIVPPGVPSAHVPIRFERILCPIDFSPSSRLALTYALSLAQEAQATLTLLHVLEAVPDEPAAAPFDPVEYHRQREADARTRLREVVPAEARTWCKPLEVVGAGRSYREILRVAAESGSDLIVMGVAGHGVLHRMFFGSTTNHVVRQARCPVLTLRGDQ
jgi:nucleotide-binding universal stress UspA family protein